MPGASVSAAATVIAAIFAAVAALASWAAVFTNWLWQRASRRPNVSASALGYPTGQTVMEFLNAGPGLAVLLAYCIVSSTRECSGIVGTGHLRAGDKASVDVTAVFSSGEEARYVWVCRDIDQRVHIWRSDGEHMHLKKGDYPNLADCFRRAFPDVPLPPKNVGADEDTTNPNESGDASSPATSE
jgi:hypothetical protein